MNLPNHAPTSLHETDVIKQLLPSAIQILQNDFHLSGIECYLNNFQGDVFHLRDSLVPVIKSIGAPTSEKFFALLYRIDVPESRVAEALSAQSEMSVESLISELIIIRALQKAYFRTKFS